MAEGDPTEGGLGSAGNPNPASDGSKQPNWEKKYKGQQKVYEEEKASRIRLEQELYDMAANHEKELATARSEARDAVKKAKEAETSASTYQTAKEQLEKELNGLKTKQTVAQRLAEEFPALLELHNTGDLREPGDFENAEKYTEYLNRLNKLASGSKATVSASGATPAVSVRGKDSKAARAMQDIEEEMWDLDTSKADDAAKYEGLLREMDLAMVKK